jgi:hypothetical protein
MVLLSELAAHLEFGRLGVIKARTLGGDGI